MSVTTVEDRTIQLLRRAPALRALEDGPLDRRAFADRLDISRSTAYRVTTALVDRGAAETVDGEYHATAYGKAVGRAADRFRSAITGADRLQPLLEYVDDPALLDAAHAFDEAEVLRSDPSNPYRVVDHVVDRLSGAETVKCTIDGTTSPSTLARLEELDDSPDRIRAIVDETAAAGADTLVDGIEQSAGSDTDLRVLVADVPLTACILDGNSVLVVGRDDVLEVPVVLAEAEAPAAVQWATRLFDRCQERSGRADRSAHEHRRLQFAAH